MSIEEGDELLLEGGQLHEYIMRTTSQQCSLYKGVKENDPLTTETLCLASPVKVSGEVKELVDIILNSAMLLDEDAHYLYILSQKLEVQPQHLHLKTLASIGSFFLAGCASIFFRKNVKVLPLWLGSTYFTVMHLRKLISFRLLSNRLLNLCSLMNLAYIRLKKHFNLLHQQVTCVTTKEVYLSQKLSKKMIGEKYIWARKQISVMSIELMNVLINILNCSRTSTLTLLKIIDKPASDEKYYACRTNSQLGLDSVLEQCQNGQLNLSTLEVVRHLNIIMQSEFLRLLGFYAYKIKTFSQREKLSAVLKHYGDTIDRLTLKPDYFKDQQPVTNQKRLICDHDNLIEAVQNLKLYLHSLVVEAADVEDILSSKHLTREEAHSTVNIVLDTLTREWEEIHLFINKIKKMIHQKKDCSNEMNIPVSAEQEQVLKTGVEVGKSDFSIKSVDEVFLGVVRNENARTCADALLDEQEAEIDSAMIATYDKVIAEFKVALQSKRKEFEERELAALKQSPNYQAYIEFQEQENVDEQTSCCVKKDFEEEVKEESEVPVDTTGFDLHRAIALKAVSKSLQWKLPVSEEINFES